MAAFKRGEKITDPAVLERLAAARAKALEVRQAKKKAKDDEKLVNDMEKKQKEHEVKTKLEKLTKPSEEPKPEASSSKADPPSDTEEEIVVVKKKKKKPKKKIVYVNESESESSEDDQEYQKPPKQRHVSPEKAPALPRTMSYIDQMYEASYGRLRRF